MTDTAEEAPADDDPGFRNIGCQIVCSPEVASEQPVRLLLSGPSGGALAAQRACARLGAF